jgi:hypothetical protein
MKYFVAENTGKGFITHQDSERSHIAGYPGNVWATESNEAWASRTNAVEKTRDEAQALIDAAIAGVTDPEGKQIVITLP